MDPSREAAQDYSPRREPWVNAWEMIEPRRGERKFSHGSFSAVIRPDSRKSRRDHRFQIVIPPGGSVPAGTGRQQIVRNIARNVVPRHDFLHLPFVFG